MNCFDFQNRISDFMDDTLDRSQTAESKKHLNSCPRCATKVERIEKIIEAVSMDRRTAAPLNIGEVPQQSYRTMRVRPSTLPHIGKSFWRSIPWYIRTTIEGLSVVLLVLAAVSTGPKLRLLYERSIERSMTELSDTFSDPLLGSSDLPPLTRGSSAGAPLPESLGEEEFVDDAEVLAGGQTDGSDDIAVLAENETTEIRVGSSEIWRFNMKTDSPHDVRARVMQIFSELRIPSDTPGLGGIEAPGGIQFDIFIPQSSVAPLKRQLQRIAPRAPQNSPLGETFAWYKNKSRRKIPPGKTRVVIWLSQM